nr:uncharacterized protein LOC129280075 [Lytechinus pictus]
MASETELDDISSEPHESPPGLRPPFGAQTASAKTPSPSPAKQPAQGPVPTSLVPSPAAVKRSLSPAFRLQPQPETSTPSTSSKGQNLFRLPDLSDLSVPGHNDPDVSSEVESALLDKEEDEISAKMHREKCAATVTVKCIKTADPFKTIETMAAESNDDDEDDGDALLAKLDDITSEPHESPPGLRPPFDVHRAVAGF